MLCPRHTVAAGSPVAKAKGFSLAGVAFSALSQAKPSDAAGDTSSLAIRLMSEAVIDKWWGDRMAAQQSRQRTAETRASEAAFAAKAATAKSPSSLPSTPGFSRPKTPPAVAAGLLSSAVPPAAVVSAGATTTMPASAEAAPAAPQSVFAAESTQSSQLSVDTHTQGPSSGKVVLVSWRRLQSVINNGDSPAAAASQLMGGGLHSGRSRSTSPVTRARSPLQVSPGTVVDDEIEECLLDQFEVEPSLLPLDSRWKPTVVRVQTELCCQDSGSACFV